MPNLKEKTLVLIKPDALQRGLSGEIFQRIEKKGLKIVGCKMVQMSDQLTEDHYGHLKEKDFFPGLKNFMQSSPVIALAVEGQEAVEVVRTLAGPTRGHKAPTGTIRGDLCISGQANIIHASDSLESAGIELKRFFQDHEIFEYQRPNLHFIYGADERPEEV